MERFTARRAAPDGSAKGGASAQETFSEMASATASRSGVVGKLLVVSLIVVSIAITAFVGYAIVSGVDAGPAAYVNDDQYQAVFLADGQIYFGKLTGLDQEYAVLEDIYYLQVEQQVQPDRDEEPATSISLAKLGNELHGPEDKMFINRDQILFWENLKDVMCGDNNDNCSQVYTAIENYKNGGEN